MIARHWSGICRQDKASDYIDHLQQQTIPGLKHIDGFISASILHRQVPDGTEFLVITLWASMDVIHQFSGEDVETAVVPAVVQEMMISYDQHARHYEVV
ncbi:MAG TPA: antibiotic biosynthesis monooxygenase [Chitinophaga sp.]|uniref:antibiotic biosynthesis monooxygenase n=1 Tax=Chitinophaga sp. TaxID=1869181 RepID=UPI002F954CE2